MSTNSLSKNCLRIASIGTKSSSANARTNTLGTAKFSSPKRWQPSKKHSMTSLNSSKIRRIWTSPTSRTRSRRISPRVLITSLSSLRTSWRNSSRSKFITWPRSSRLLRRIRPRRGSRRTTTVFYLDLESNRITLTTGFTTLLVKTLAANSTQKD